MGVPSDSHALIQGRRYLVVDSEGIEDSVTVVFIRYSSVVFENDTAVCHTVNEDINIRHLLTCERNLYYLQEEIA